MERQGNVGVMVPEILEPGHEPLGGKACGQCDADRAIRSPGTKSRHPCRYGAEPIPQRLCQLLALGRERHTPPIAGDKGCVQKGLERAHLLGHGGMCHVQGAGGL